MFAVDRYEKPASLAEAIQLLAEDPQSVALAGGTDVLVHLREHREPAFLVDISGLPELLAESRSPEGTVRLGAGLTFSRLIASPLVQAHVPILAEAADTVAGPQIRNMGTLGGNICNGAVSADSVAPLLALDARLHLFGPEGERRIDLAGFHLGPGKVALKPAEILMAVDIDAQAWQGVGMAWEKYAMRKAMDIATIGCAASVRLDGENLEWLKLAFSVSAPVPIRCPAAEAVAQGASAVGEGLKKTLAAVADAVEGDVNPRSSWRAEKDFRLHIIRTLAARVTREAVRRAGGSENSGILRGSL